MLKNFEATPLNIAIAIIGYTILLIVFYHIAKRAVWLWDKPLGQQNYRDKNPHKRKTNRQNSVESIEDEKMADNQTIEEIDFS